VEASRNKDIRIKLKMYAELPNGGRAPFMLPSFAIMRDGYKRFREYIPEIMPMAQQMLLQDETRDMFPYVREVEISMFTENGYNKVYTVHVAPDNKKKELVFIELEDKSRGVIIETTRIDPVLVVEV